MMVTSRHYSKKDTCLVVTDSEQESFRWTVDAYLSQWCFHPPLLESTMTVFAWVHLDEMSVF